MKKTVKIFVAKLQVYSATCEADLNVHYANYDEKTIHVSDNPIINLREPILDLYEGDTQLNIAIKKLIRERLIEIGKESL